MKLVKKIISAVLSAAMLSAAMVPLGAYASSDDIDMIMVMGRGKAYVNGEIIRIYDGNTNAAPLEKNGVVMIPVRAAAEAMGAAVGYDGATGEVSVDGSGHSLRLKVGSDSLTIDGTETQMEAPVQMANDISLIPALIFVEALGNKVFWNREGIIVIGNESLNPNKEKAFISETVNKITGDKYWTYTQADFVPLKDQQQNVSFQTITPEMVKKAIEETGTIDTHPSLFSTQEDLDRMKQYLEDGDPVFKAINDYNIKLANNALVYPIPNYHLDAANLRVEDLHGFGVNSLPPLAYAYKMTEDPTYLKRIKEVMAAMTTFDDWGAPRHFLDAGVATSYLAIAYDIVYDKLSKQEKADVENAIMELTLKPGLDGMKNGAFWTYSGQNWNGICHTGIRLGAYLCYHNNPDLCAEIIALSMNNETAYIREFEPMGQTEEGQSYFDYGLSFAEVGFEVDKHIMGTDFGLSDTNGLKNAGWFPLRSGGTVTSISIGDADVISGVAMPRMWLATHFDDTTLGKIIFDQMKGAATYDWRLLQFYNKEFYDRCQSAGEAEMSQLDNLIPALDIISFRNKWATSGNFIAMHAASNTASHGHLDAGQVDIQANGVHWVMGSLGKDIYTYPGYFDATRPDYNDAKTEQKVAGRNHFYRVRAEGKTAVVVQGDGTPDIRPDQNPQGVPVIERIISKPRGAYSVVDLTECYNRDVQSYKRGIMMSENRQLMTIQDEIVAKSEDATIWWLLNTPAEIKISEDKKTALFTYQGKTMWVGLSSPSNGELKEISPTYLPGEEFPLSVNSVNTTHKLAVELPQTQRATITVNFVPLGIGETEPNINVPKSKPMDKWTIENGSLIETAKPTLTNLTIDGVTPEEFAPDQYTYTYISPMSIDSTVTPEVVGTADADVSYSYDENITTITVADRTDPKNYTKYQVTVKKMGAPSMTQHKIAKATASDNPQFNHLDEYVIDGDLDADARWSAEGEQTLDLDLGSSKNIKYFGMMVLNGTTRRQLFDVLTSDDKENWETVYEGKSNGETDGFEYYKLKESTGRYVRIAVHGTETGSWNSIVEVQVFGN